jgi:hypothetical protein
MSMRSIDRDVAALYPVAMTLQPKRAVADERLDGWRAGHVFEGHLER